MENKEMKEENGLTESEHEKALELARGFWDSPEGKRTLRKSREREMTKADFNDEN